jgi:hypothetical protein
VVIWKYQQLGKKKDDLNLAKQQKLLVGKAPV